MSIFLYLGPVVYSFIWTLFLCPFSCWIITTILLVLVLFISWKFFCIGEMKPLSPLKVLIFSSLIFLSFFFCLQWFFVIEFLFYIVKTLIFSFRYDFWDLPRKIFYTPGFILEKSCAFFWREKIGTVAQRSWYRFGVTQRVSQPQAPEETTNFGQAPPKQPSPELWGWGRDLVCRNLKVIF